MTAPVAPMEARCEHCHDTGSLSKWTGGDLDCTHCDSAEKRGALYATVEAARKVAMGEYRLASFDAVWLAYQLGQAAPVARPAQQVEADESHSDATQRAFESSAKARGYKLERDELGRYRDTHIHDAWNIMTDTVAQLAVGRHFTNGRLKLAEQALIKNGFTKIDDVWAAPQLEAQQAGDVWQPIDTAPRGANGASFMTLAWGAEGDQCTGQGMRIDEEFYAAGVFFQNGNKHKPFELRETKINPTHWKPNPLTPDEEKS